MIKLTEKLYLGEPITNVGDIARIAGRTPLYRMGAFLLPQYLSCITRGICAWVAT